MAIRKENLFDIVKNILLELFEEVLTMANTKIKTLAYCV